MELSRHVLRKEDIYFNTVTRKSLPTNTSADELQQHYFLAGQEAAAIQHVLLNRPIRTDLGLSVIPTWECNLRCTHCIVRDQLVEDQTERLDVPAITKYVSRCVDRYKLENLIVRFCGGECLLVVADCTELIDSLSKVVNTSFSLFTNLAVSLTREHIEFLSKALMIGVSIDGTETQHNAQRLPLIDNGDNLYQLTMSNLKQLVLAGLKDKIEVQACLRDEFNTRDNHKEFFRTIVPYGISPHLIRIGTIGPSRVTPQPGKIFVDGLQGPHIIPTACCKYRQHTLVTDPSGGIFSDYYSYTRLGSIYDDPAVIEAQQEKLIKETAPALVDPKCKACPVVGYCWGGCSVIENTGNRLSKYCDNRRKALQDRIFIQGEIWR